MLGEIRLGQVRLGLSKHLPQLTDSSNRRGSANPQNTTKMEAAAIVEGTDPIGEADASTESEEDETEVLYIAMVNIYL